MMTILNLTQHIATPEQRAAGVVDLAVRERATLAALLTFDAVPSAQALGERASAVAGLARRVATELGAETCLIGGEPWLTRALEDALMEMGLVPIYAARLVGR